MCKIGEPLRFDGSTIKNRSHICAFANTAEEARGCLLQFIGESLEAGDKTLHTIDPRKRRTNRNSSTPAA